MTKIERIEKLSGHEAMGYAVRVNSIMISEGTASKSFVMVAWDDKAVVACDGNDGFIGLITYFIIDWRSELAIKLGYVEPVYRHQGIYKKLWEELVLIAQEKKCRTITGVTHSDNHAMRKVAEKLGRTEYSINLRFCVPGT